MLTDAERGEIETLLRREREEALAALRKFDEERSESLQEEAGEMSMYRFHMADIGTEEMEREKQFLLGSQEGERLYRTDEALRRLYSDPEGFGRCQSCGREIGMDRLRLVPASTLCADHQRQAEGQPAG